MKRLLLFLLFSSFGLSYGQESAVNLDDCYRLAREHYPKLADSKRQKEISELRMKNMDVVWNPMMNLNGQATYQSEVTRVNVPIPGITIPSPYRDQYKVYLDLKQNIYDGGLSAANKSLEESALAADLQSIEVELYTLRDKVNLLYFTILLMRENEAVLRLKQGLLDERIAVLESGYRNGVATLRDLELLKAERLLTMQQTNEVHAEMLSGLGALGIMINRTLNENTILAEPVTGVRSNTISRPELKYFDLLGHKIDQNAQLLEKSRNPKLFGFGQAGYGRPGLNMLKNTFDPYYLVGVGVSWTILDWKQTERNRRILESQKEMINSQRALFDQNLSIQLFKAGEAIARAERLIGMDVELLALRENIARHAASQLENGTITSADYLVDLNAVTQARINKKSHQVQLYQAVANYNTWAGQP